MDKNYRFSKDASLSFAVKALRELELVRSEGLDDEIRSRIVASAVNGAGELPREFPLFLPMRRWIVAAGLPLAMVLGLLALPALHNSSASKDVGRLTVSKEDGQVVFALKNGKQAHTVYRSTVPNRFDSASGVRMRNGTYADDVQDGQGLVFYKID